MALPIAPTPVLTGESALALERYMQESRTKREPLIPHKVDLAEIDRILRARPKPDARSSKK